jgi:hypothetical protein
LSLSLNNGTIFNDKMSDPILPDKVYAKTLAVSFSNNRLDLVQDQATVNIHVKLTVNKPVQNQEQ